MIEGKPFDPTEFISERTKLDHDTGCWMWSLSKNDKGYGMTMYAGKRWLSHRLAWMIFKGENPGELCVLHKCDTPACCNPDHLFTGTQAENVRDMDEKGRRGDSANYGEDHGMCRISNDDVGRMREMHKSGEYSHRQLARHFGISRAHVGRLVRYENRIVMAKGGE